jgi:hypothetical protein
MVLLGDSVLFVRSYSSLLPATIIAFTLLFNIKASQAQALAWRCVDAPGESTCQEALINDIEDLTIGNVPNPLIVSMPDLPYSCRRVGSSDRAASLTGGLSWSVSLMFGGLPSFLIGRHTASGDLAGTIHASGPNISAATHPSQAIHYLYQASSVEVMAAGGSTGVADLGTATSIAEGSFWGSSLHAHIDLPRGTFSCTVGYPGQTIRVSGTGAVDFDYPIASTPVRSVISDAVRTSFRTAVLIAIGAVP